MHINSGASIMGVLEDRSSDAKAEKRKILHMLRELWLSGNSPLHRIYSSWEELETNLEVRTDMEGQENHMLLPCPTCGAMQKIIPPFEGIFPYQTCQSCRHPFYINKDLTLRKLTEDEKRELPSAWIQVVEDMNKKNVAVVFRLE